MDMDNAELKDLRELKAIKELYGWTDETRDYKIQATLVGQLHWNMPGKHCCVCSFFVRNVQNTV